MLIRGDRLTGVVLPILPLNATTSIRALHADAWSVDDTQRLLLRGDVSIEIGSYSFQTDQAILWLNRIPSAEGLINQLAIFTGDLQDPTSNAGLGVDGSRVLVTASTRGEINLDVGLLEKHRPAAGDFIRDGESRLKKHLEEIVLSPPELTDRPVESAPPAPASSFIPAPGGNVSETNIPKTVRVPTPPTTSSAPWLSSPTGTVRYSADRIETQTGESEDVATVTGHLYFEISNPQSDDPLATITLTADRAIIFAKAGAFKSNQEGVLASSQLTGIYLEGNVAAASEGERYHVRAPQMYYDFQTNRAIMTQSILRVKARPNQPPMYSRAQEMRQTAKDQWDAREVRVSTSEFYSPHLSVGAEKLHIQQVAGNAPNDPPITEYQAQGVTMRAGDVPFFYWPSVTGEGRDVPLKAVEIGTRKNDGVQMKTTWDPFVLAGTKAPDGVSADLRAD
ncbi:MAG TPA: hypothetical protein VG711_01145, partial [Phycisphaerales bacterium]|nr:hypothetical protein [Phycisphaerales bacterium]